MDAVELVRGTRFTVVALRGDRAERSHIEAYLDEQPEPQRRKLARAIVHFAEHGPVYNLQKCKRLKGRAAELIELKVKPCRLLGFYCPFHRALLVLTHGFDKRTETTPEAEIDRALHLRERYIELVSAE